MTDLITTRARSAPAVAVTRGDRASRWSVACVIGTALLLGAFPFAVDPSVTSDLVKLFYLIALASMWNLLAGYAGMVSIGQQAYIGLGAYALFVINDHGLDVWSGAFVVALIVGLIAWPVSYLAFRLRGGYFAVGTWVIAEVARLIIVRFHSLGAGEGRQLSSITTDPLQRRADTYWLALVVMVAAVGAVYWVLRSRVGLDMQAARDDEIGARSLGVDPTRARRIVYIVAAAGCAAVGAVICISGLGVADPDRIFGVQYSAFAIFMVVIGGIGTVEGPIIGATLYFALDHYLSQSGVWYLVIVGAAAIVVALYLPRGLWGTLAEHTGAQVFAVKQRVRRTS